MVGDILGALAGFIFYFALFMVSNQIKHGSGLSLNDMPLHALIGIMLGSIVGLGVGHLLYTRKTARRRKEVLLQLQRENAEEYDAWKTSSLSSNEN